MRIPLLLLALLWQPTLHATTMTIGTGGEQGIYYQVIKEFCRLAKKSDPTMPCKLQASSGSIENLRQLEEAFIARIDADDNLLVRDDGRAGEVGRPYQRRLVAKDVELRVEAVARVKPQLNLRVLHEPFERLWVCRKP